MKIVLYIPSAVECNPGLRSFLSTSSSKIEDEIAEVPILGRGDHRREEHRYDVLMCRKEYGNGGVQVESLGYAIACRAI